MLFQKWVDDQLEREVNIPERRRLEKEKAELRLKELEQVIKSEGMEKGN